MKQQLLAEILRGVASLLAFVEICPKKYEQIGKKYLKLEIRCVKLNMIMESCIIVKKFMKEGIE